MEFYKFINSKAIREHLRKINWPIEPDAAAWLIWHWEGPIKEKIAGWEHIINETEDRELRGGLELGETSSLHEFLGKTIDIYKRHTESFLENNTECCYKLRTYYKNLDYCDKVTTFSTKRIPVNFNRRNVLKFEVTKQGYDSDDKETSTLNTELEMTGYDSTDDEWQNIKAVFMNQWFYFPIPFKAGDIIRSTAHPDLGPMVYEDSIYNSWIFRNNSEDFHSGKRGDVTDMIISAYRVNDDLEPFSDTLWPLTDFDYFDDADARAYVNSNIYGNNNLDQYKMLLLIREALIGELGLEILFSGYKQLINKSSVGTDYASYIFSKAERLVD